MPRAGRTSGRAPRVATSRDRASVRWHSAPRADRSRCGRSRLHFPTMLGRFLEVSLRAHDVQASVEFYESIGFVQATVGDAIEHPYAVVTDGRLFLGLHQWDLPSPILTWVRPDVARHVEEFTALGIEPAFARLDEVALNELAFADPSGQMVMLIEARTFSPPPYAPRPATACGYFEEFGIPTPDL